MLNRWNKKQEIQIWDLGRRSYKEVHTLQKELVAKKKKDPTTEDYLILVEHDPVYTAGRRNWETLSTVKYENTAQNQTTVQYQTAEQKSLQIELIERGGEVTFHNPGQLVVYPILFFPKEKRDVTGYIRSLEEGIGQVVEYFGITPSVVRGLTGVWVGEGRRKIASIGVAFSGWVSYHGFALNVNNDLSGFNEISPCGLSGSVMTSLQKELDQKQNQSEEQSQEARKVEIDEVKLRVQEVFLSPG